MAGVELHAAQLVEVGSRRLHELDRAVDLGREALVALVGGVLREPLVPAVHLPKVGESPLRERPDEVQRRCCGVVAAQQSPRIGRARGLGEVVPVDDVAPVRRQRHVTARLGVLRTRFGELPRHAAHLHDGHRGAVGEHDRHLQHGLDAVADLLGGGPGESLRAVAALEQERLAGGGPRESLAQEIDLAGEDERRKSGDLVRDRSDGGCVGPRRLLLDREGPPVVEGV